MPSIFANVATLVMQGKQIMAALDDLKAAVAANRAELATFIAAFNAMKVNVVALTAQIATLNAAGANDPAIAQAASDIAAETAAMSAALAPPPPPPAPAAAS